MSAISPLMLEQGIPLLERPSATGTLQWREVRRILNDEVQFLNQLVHYPAGGGLWRAHINDWTAPSGNRLLSPNARFLMHFVPITCLSCCFVAVTTATLALRFWEEAIYVQSEDPDFPMSPVLYSGWDAILMGADLLLFVGLLVVMPCWAVTCHMLMPGVEYSVVKRIHQRREIISNFLANESQSNPLVAAQLLAKLISQVELRKETEASLIGKASFREFRQILDLLEGLGMQTIQLKPSHQALRTLLRNPPIDLNQYHELLIRAEDNFSESDYGDLRELLPADDPRQGFLNPWNEDLSTAESFESSSVESTTLTIPMEIVVEDEVIYVNPMQLRLQSKWFSDQFIGGRGVHRIVISPLKIFKEPLINVFKGLEKPRSELWIPIESSRVDYLINLFKCLKQYEFYVIATELAWELYTSGILELKDEVMLASFVLANEGSSQETKDLWESLIISHLKNTKDEKTFKAWFTLALEHGQDSIILVYMGYLMGNPNALTARVITWLIPYRESLSLLMPFIIRRVQENWTSLDSEGFYVRNKQMVQWIAEQMNHPDSQFLSEFIFQWLWCKPEWRAHAEIDEALIRYAKDPKNKFKVIAWWPPGTLPDDLVVHLHP